MPAPLPPRPTGLRLSLLLCSAAVAVLAWSLASRPPRRPNAAIPEATVQTETALVAATTAPADDFDFFRAAWEWFVVADALGGQRVTKPVEAKPAAIAPVAPMPAVVKTEEPPPTPPPAVAPAPILPPYDFSPAARRNPEKLAALRADTHARLLDGRWEDHLARLRPGLKAALAATRADPDGKTSDELARDPLFALGAGQALLIARAAGDEEFVQRSGPEVLRRLAGTEGAQGFLEDLLGKPASMQAFLSQVKPEDDAAAALKVWSTLWNAEPTPLRGKYLNLQVAFALVFDRELPAFDEVDVNIDPSKRYAFLRDAAEAGKLKSDVAKLPADALIWVAGNDIRDTDMYWAHQEQKLRHLAAADWGKPFEVVNKGGTLVKEMELKNKGTAGTETPFTKRQQELLDSVDQGSLEQQYKFGREGARFVVGAARAYGVPAAVLTGVKVGPNPTRTWVAFQRDGHHWDLTLGRADAGAASGVAFDPQTRKNVREFEIEALGDRKHDGPDAERASRLRLLARLAGQVGEPARQHALFAAACRLTPRAIPLWRERLAALAADDSAPATPWADILRELRQDFVGMPDMRDLADDYEARFILGRLPATDAVRAIQGNLRKLERDYPQRRDLVTAGIARAGRILAKDRTANAAALSTLYRGAFDDCADDMVAFRGLLADYYALIKDEEKLELRFLDDIERAFRRKVKLEPMEFYSMTEELYVYFRKCGQSHRGLRLRQEGANVREAYLKSMGLKDR